MNNNTWKLVDLQSDKRAIRCKWIFKLKENLDGTVLRHKARLVAQRFNQVAGFDYSETFSHLAKPATVRVILSIVVQKN